MKNFHRVEDFPPDITANVILNAAVCQGAAAHFNKKVRIPRLFGWNYLKSL
jgi:hypothetical protein